MSTSIPVELYRPVLESAGSRSDLCVAARVSRSMQHEAERLIYQTIELRTLVEIVPAFRTLSKTARFDLYVTTLSIDIPKYHDPSAPRKSLTPLLRSFTGLISRTLQLLRNLKHLHVSEIYGSNYSWKFLPCNFRLRTFTFTPLRSHDVVPFLHQQTDLQQLTLWTTSDHRWTAFPLNFLGSLAVLSAGPNIAKRLLPGRRVAILRSWSTRDVPLPSLLPLSAVTLRALDIGPGFIPDEYLQLPHLAPELELLGGLSGRHWNDINGVKQWFNVLSPFKKLWGVHFIKFCPDDAFPAFLAQLHRAVPRVRAVEIHDDPEAQTRWDLMSGVWVERDYSFTPLWDELILKCVP